MILAMDIGNTNIEIGVLADEVNDFSIIASARYYTRLDITSDQLGLFLAEFLNASNISRTNIKKVIFSSVVPPLDNLVRKMFLDYFSSDVVEVGKNTKMGIKNCYKEPKEVGSDRLVNAAGAYWLYKKDCILVDMGTAITLCVVTGDGRYLGGAIFPGVATSTDALTKKAARLPAIKLQAKKKLLSDDTASAIESGIYFSYYYALKGMLEQLGKEVGFTDFLRIGTGGFASFYDSSDLFDKIDPLLTLKGLKIIADLNKK